jgi:hypothetical protein
MALCQNLLTSWLVINPVIELVSAVNFVPETGGDQDVRRGLSVKC